MTIFYFNITSHIPPRDNIYLKALQKLGYVVVKFQDNSPGLKKFFRIAVQYIKHKGSADFVWVGYTAYLLVPLVKLLTLKPLYFNAFSSLYEGMIISRKVAGAFSLTSFKYWLIDFISFQLASSVAVETNHQKNFIAHFFWVNPKKLIRVWTGADDEYFYKDDNVKKFETFTVVFRGAFLPEAGAECAVEAANILGDRDDIRFRVIGGGLLENEIKAKVELYNLPNLELITGKFSMDELRLMMLPCHVSLGQLANHERLSRTIPHKAFESVAMGLTYLTARTAGILELFEEENTCFCFKPGDAADLAATIVSIKDNVASFEKVGSNAYTYYQTELRSDILANNLIKQIKKVAYAN